jgi:hypothetical protein
MENKTIEICLDEVELDYNEDLKLYYFDCECSNELTLPILRLKEPTIIMNCVNCNTNLKLLYYNHLNIENNIKNN